MKNELHHILSGASAVSHGTVIQAISRYLRESAHAGTAAKGYKHYKKQETERLEQYVSENGLWVKDVDFTQYVSQGAEQGFILKIPAM